MRALTRQQQLQQQSGRQHLKQQSLHLNASSKLRQRLTLACSAAEQQPAAQPAGLAAPLPPVTAPEEPPKKLSPAARLSEELASTSITIVGEDSELNWAVCQALSKRIGWFPVHTAKVLRGLHRAANDEELREALGPTGLAEAEASVLRGMKTQVRCCIATLGDGAAADAAVYDALWGSIIVWLDEEDRRTSRQGSAARRVFADVAEVRATLSGDKGGFGEQTLSAADKAQRAASQLIKALTQLLQQYDYLPAKKRAYIERGCRGDWPELQPPEWSPVLEAFGRKSVQSLEEDEEEKAAAPGGAGEAVV